MKKKSGNGSRKDDLETDIPVVTRMEMQRGVMGKYSRETPAGQRFIELDGDIAKRFPDNQTVNDALRLVLKLQEIGNNRRKKSA